jgi:hypothetical protein
MPKYLIGIQYDEREFELKKSILVVAGVTIGVARCVG